MTQYHILNGDALKSHFPPSIKGEQIVARECLVDGAVNGESLEELFETRVQFISQHYGATTEEYQEKVVSEFQRIRNIESGTEINLWFEDDLFCQVNMWFVLSLLKGKDNPIFLVRPDVHTRYGFGGLDEEGLLSIYENRKEMTELDKLSNFWKTYQSENIDQLLAQAKELRAVYPFMLDAVQAHIARIPKGDSLGRPTETLIQIMKDLDTEDFGPIFQAFCERESIYGFGDSQVKRLLRAIKNQG